jgi:hypothetical protein
MVLIALPQISFHTTQMSYRYLLGIPAAVQLHAHETKLLDEIHVSYSRKEAKSTSILFI